MTHLFTHLRCDDSSFPWLIVVVVMVIPGRPSMCLYRCLSVCVLTDQTAQPFTYLLHSCTLRRRRRRSLCYLLNLCNVVNNVTWLCFHFSAGAVYNNNSVVIVVTSGDSEWSTYRGCSKLYSWAVKVFVQVVDQLEYQCIQRIRDCFTSLLTYLQWLYVSCSLLPM